MDITSQQQQPNDWNTFYLTTPADDIPWEAGCPSAELYRAVSEGYIVAPARVLDIGCGLGTQSIFLAKNGFEVIGVDIAPKAIEKAQKLAQFAQVSPQFIVADATALPFSRDSFDIVYDRGCFHHLTIQAQERYKSEVERLMTEGGTFILTVFAQAIAAKTVEQFFLPEFELIDEENFSVIEKVTGNSITLRSLSFEKQPSLFFESN